MVSICVSCWGRSYCSYFLILRSKPLAEVSHRRKIVINLHSDCITCTYTKYISSTRVKYQPWRQLYLTLIMLSRQITRITHAQLYISQWCIQVTVTHLIKRIHLLCSSAKYKATISLLFTIHNECHFTIQKYRNFSYIFYWICYYY